VTSGRQRSLDAGMSDYISKPIELDDLARTLRAWLRPPVHRRPGGEGGAPAKVRESARTVLQ
jgi:DNA-binding response OmpR family regulator